jgi:hypothetical protein
MDRQFCAPRTAPVSTPKFVSPDDRVYAVGVDDVDRVFEDVQVPDSV